MENHPIPQDVTGFQFKLIGDMTVKQFAYLAAGVIMGWIFFALPLPAIIRLPLALGFIGTGVSFAFLPIEGRPLDVMVTHFVRALFAPNQFVYQKMGGDYSLHFKAQAAPVAVETPAQANQKLQQYLQSIPQKSKNKLDEKEQVFFQSIASLSNASYQSPIVQPTVQFNPPPPPPPLPPKETPVVVAPPPAPAPVTPDGPNPIEEQLREQAVLLQQQLQEAKSQEEKQKQMGGSPAAHQKVQSLEAQLNEILQQKKALEDQLLILSKKLQETEKQQVFTPGEGQAKQESTHVRKIAPGMGKAAGLPTTSEFPNLLMGIVKDPRGNILPNILVEVQDSNGNPVRAFKTNNLGQFASATPLLNGTYTLMFEDPQAKNKFDAVEIEANGSVITPIEIISMDAREQLRKDLFGG